MLGICFLVFIAAPSLQARDTGMAFIDKQLAQHANKSGIYVLEKGEQALLARAWLADHAQKSIEVQYFIWSTDNIGILASEALLRAAERGVKVRVIVDDLLIDAPDESLLALALHPNIEIRIYNPKHSVGTSFFKRVINHKIMVPYGLNVKRGDLIGLSGSTGTSSGPHLHYQIEQLGQHKNPINYFNNDISAEEFNEMIQAFESKSKFK